MAVQHMDGFDWLIDNMMTEETMQRAKYYGSGAFGGQSGIVISGNDPVIGRFDYGKALPIRTFASARNQWTRVLPDPRAEMIMGASFKRVDGLGHEALGGPSLVFFDMVNGQRIISATAGPRGIVFVEGPDNSIIAQSEPGVLEDETWFNMQVRCVCSNVLGQVEVKINNRVVVLAESLNTLPVGSSGLIEGYGFGGTNRGSVAVLAYIDDMYCMDTASGSNTGFLGNARVKSQMMIADGSNIDSTIGGSAPAATHWQSVRNQSFDDTQYVAEPTVGEFDWYEVDPNLNNGVIYALQTRVVARQDDATQRTMKGRLKSSTSIVSGTEYFLNQTYTHYTDVFELDPDTGIGWLPAQANANEAGFIVES